jgi:hypothetical protein
MTGELPSTSLPNDWYKTVHDVLVIDKVALILCCFFAFEAIEGRLGLSLDMELEIMFQSSFITYRRQHLGMPLFRFLGFWFLPLAAFNKKLLLADRSIPPCDPRGRPSSGLVTQIAAQKPNGSES